MSTPVPPAHDLRRVLERLSRRVERRFRSGFERRLALVRARRHTQHPATQRPRHADGGQADATPRAEDEHGLAGRGVAAVAQREETRAVALREGRSPRRVHPFGQRDHRGRGHDDTAGESAEAHGGQHPVADGHPADVGPERHDVPGHLAPRDERERRLDLVLPGHEEAVHEIHTGRLHLHRHLPRSGLGVGPLLHP